MADVRLDTERDERIRSVVSTLKTLADATEGDARQLLPRLAAKAVVHHLRKEETVKVAHMPTEAIAIAAHAEKRHGAAFVGYEPETLLDLGYGLSDVTKIMAIKYALYYPEPFVDWHVFEKVVLALAGRDVVFDTPQELTVSECAWGVDCLRYLDAVTPFSAEVAAYVAAVAHEEGFVAVPAVLGFAALALGGLTSDVGRVLAGRVAAGETTPQAAKIQSVTDYVNARHARLLAELKQV